MEILFRFHLQLATGNSHVDLTTGLKRAKSVGQSHGPMTRLLQVEPEMVKTSVVTMRKENLSEVQRPHRSIRETRRAMYFSEDGEENENNGRSFQGP